MSRTGVLIGLLVALLLGAWTAALAEPPHRSTGIVMAISPTRLVMTENGGRHPLTITPATEIAIAEEDGVSRIGVGDYVAEECVPDRKGGHRATRLTLYRPAWLEISSPEN